MANQVFATGSCLCGNVKCSITEKPVRMAQCHCQDCRKSTGTGHCSNAFFPTESVEIVGETFSYDSITDTGNVNSRHFCPNCGSRLFSIKNISPEITGIAMGFLDNNDWFKADFIVYSSQQSDWDIMDETIQSFEKMPPD